MAIEIVDLPIENGGSFHSYVNVYQRVMGMYGPGQQPTPLVMVMVLYGLGSVSLACIAHEILTVASIWLLQRYFIGNMLQIEQAVAYQLDLKGIKYVCIPFTLW